jgi:hypothetical protein
MEHARSPKPHDAASELKWPGPAACFIAQRTLNRFIEKPSRQIGLRPGVQRLRMVPIKPLAQLFKLPGRKLPDRLLDLFDSLQCHRNLAVWSDYMEANNDRNIGLSRQH